MMHGRGRVSAASRVPPEVGHRKAGKVENCAVTSCADDDSKAQVNITVRNVPSLSLRLFYL
jgi:hypothetical protein